MFTNTLSRRSPERTRKAPHDLATPRRTHPACLQGWRHTETEEAEGPEHTTNLASLQLLEPHVKDNGNDRTDADAICHELLQAKHTLCPCSLQQQSARSLHRVRRGCVTTCTAKHRSASAKDADQTAATVTMPLLSCRRLGESGSKGRGAGTSPTAGPAPAPSVAADWHCPGPPPPRRPAHCRL